MQHVKNATTKNEYKQVQIISDILKPLQRFGATCTSSIMRYEMVYTEMYTWNRTQIMIDTGLLCVCWSSSIDYSK